MSARLPLIAALCVVGASAHAADKPRIAPPEAWVLAPLVAGGPSPTVSGAAAAFLAEDVQLHFDETGMSRYSEIQAKIQTSDGLGALGALSLAWSPPTDVLTIHRLTIHRGAEVIDCLPKDGVFTIVRREAKLETEATLDGVLTVVLRPEGLQVGDVIDMATTMRREDPLVKGRVDDAIGNFDTLPAPTLRLRATWPTTAGVQWRAREGLADPVIAKAGGETSATLEAREMMPVAKPKEAPARFQSGRSLEFSNYPSWAAVSAHLQPFYADAARITPGGPLDIEVKSIATKTADPAARAEAAIALVERMVRYFDLAMGENGLKPASADLTWSRRWGDCKAKAVLLVAVLNALRIEAEPVYVSVALGDGLDQRLPSLGVFDHAIVRATIGGRTWWFDATRTIDTRLSRIKTPALGWVLPVRAKGAMLQRLVAEPADAPELTTNLRLDASRGITLPAATHIQVVFRGDAAAVLHNTVANLTPTDLDTALRDYFRKAYDFVTPTTMSAAYDEATGEETFKLDGAAKLDWSDGYEADGASLGWKFDAHRAPGPHADAPWKIAFPDYSATEETILLPRQGVGFTIAGDNVDRDLLGRHFQRKAWLAGGAFHLESSTRSLVPELDNATAQAAAAPMAAMSKTTIRLQATNDYAWTSAELRTAMATEPTTVDEYLSRAGALMNARRNREAVRDLDKAKAMDPPRADVLSALGLAHAWLGEEALAAPNLDAAEKLDPKDPKIWRARGLLAEKAKRWPDAVSNYQRVLTIERDDAFALGHLMIVYKDAKDFTLALQAVDRFADAHPNGGVDRHAARAELYFLMGDPPRSKQEIDLTVAALKEPERGFRRIEMFKSIGDTSDAQIEADKLVAAAPSAQAYLLRASVRSPDHLAEVADDLNKAFALEPKNLNALVSLRMTETALKNYPQADMWLAKALAVAPDDAELLAMNAERELRGGAAHDVVAADYARVRKLAAGDAGALNMLCWSEATHDFDLVPALADCDAAVGLAPGNSAILDSRAFVLLRLNRNREAAAGYTAAIADTPRPESLFGRSLAEARNNDPDAAARDRKAAVAAKPTVERDFSEYGVTK